MSHSYAGFKFIGRLRGWLLSFPIYFKIMGIGAIIAALFGCGVLLKIRISLANELYDLLKQRTTSLGIVISRQLERSVITGDYYAVNQKLKHIKESFPEILYFIVVDGEGRIIAHTFDKGVPRTLAELTPDSMPESASVQIFDSPGGIIVESTVGLLEGRAGKLRLAVSDRNIVEKISEMTKSIIFILLLCLALGQILAMFLTYLITRPIRLLSLATERLRQGEYGVQAVISSGDEIGALTASFNNMSRELQIIHAKIRENEALRTQLIQKTVSAQEEERKRIARELHDELGQSLSALLLTIQSKAPYKTETSSEIHDEIVTGVQSIIKEISRLALDLRPSLLDDYGLYSALLRYTEEVSRKTGIAIDFHYSGLSKDERLSDKVEITLFRIAQEAITNIVRHAKARQTCVVLMKADGEITLLIEDDGCGFDPVEANSAKVPPLGVIGMEERTALLGGSFTLESSIGNGTTIRIKLPI